MPDYYITDKADATTTTGLKMPGAQGGVGVAVPATLFASAVALSNGLAGKENTGVAASLIAAHEAAVNPHPNYATDTDLSTGLAGKSDTGHSHSGLAPAGGSTGQVLKKVSNTDYDYSWQADATGGGGSTAPIVADQTIEFGRLTISGAGGAELSLTSGTYTSITLGTRTIGSNHFTTSGTLITPTAVPSDPLYRWTGCTVSDGTNTSDPFTLTIETLPNAYSIRSAAQLSAVISAIGTASTNPITIYGRNVDLGVLTSGSPFAGISYVNRVTLASHDSRQVDGALVAPLKIQLLHVTNCPLLSFRNVKFQSQPSVAQGSYAGYAHCALIGPSTTNIVFDGCEFCADDVFDPTSNALASTGFWGDFVGIACVSDGSGTPGSLTVTNCYFHDIGYGVKFGLQSGSAVFTGNKVRRYYHMAAQFSRPAATNIPTRFSFNDVGLPLGRSGDPNGPHCDAAQFLALGLTSDWTDIEAIGNRVWFGYARGNPQGLFFSDMPVGYFFTAKVIGNLIENGSYSAIEISRSKDCEITGNTCVPPYGQTEASLARILVGQTASSGNSLVRDNISTDFLLGTAVTSSNNVDLSNPGPYDTQIVFVGPWVTAGDVDHLTEMYRIKPKGAADILEPKAGVSPYIDYVNRRFDSPRFRGIGVTEQLTTLIASPSNKDYRLAVKMPYAFKVTECTTVSASGTCTATFKINTTTLGGTANSVSSTEQTQAHTTSNTGAAGDDIVLTVSANSSCVDLALKVEWVRLG